MRNSTAVIGIAIVHCLAGGCAAGPEYQPPELDIGDGWIEPSRGAEQVVELDAWWRSFGDPTLDELIEQALAENLAVRQAEQRVAEARELRAVAGAGRYPGIDASASVTRRRQSENGPFPINEIPGLERDQTIYEPGFDALWELDLFGRTRRAVEGADARFEAARANARAVRLTMASEVARSYLELRGAQHELMARRAAVAASREAVALLRRRLEAGDLAETAVAQAELDLATAEAELPLANASVRAAALSIGTLLGGLPESQLELLDQTTAYPALMPFPVGERAELLRRRPDVRAAERALAANTADLGVAAAELFPRFTIGANGGFQSLDTSTLLDSASETFALVPLISWRFLDGGRIRAQVRAAETRVELAALAYEQTVMEALGDAERALLQYDSGLAALDRQDAALQAAQRSYSHATARYEAGDISRLELLQTEGVLRSAERAYARVHTRTATDLVALCKALGGSWG